MKFETSLELRLRVEFFDNEANEKFICIRDKDSDSIVYFSAWLTQSEIHKHWDIIARNITQSFKTEILREMNRPTITE
jgi:hypothetical protein